MYLVVGLGNPGKQYATTRHNAGFMAVDEIARELKAPSFRLNKRFHALVTEQEISTQGPESNMLPTDHCSLVLAKPQTFMNESGISVKTLIRNKKYDISRQLIIISDDLDLPFGTLRLRERGSAGGHNGLRSIIATLGTSIFPRLKIGIRPPRLTRQPGKAEDFVLERFTEEELEQLKKDVIPRAVRTILERITNNES